MKLFGIPLFYLVPPLIFGPIFFFLLYSFGLRDVIRATREDRQRRRRMKEETERQMATHGRRRRVRQPPVNIDEISNLLEREKGYCKRQEDVKKRPLARDRGVHRADQKIRIFEKTEQQKVAGDPQRQPNPAAMARIQGTADQIVAGYRGKQKKNMPRNEPAIKNKRCTGQDEHGRSGPPAADQPDRGNRQRQKREDEDVTVKEHRPSLRLPDPR